MKVIGPKIWSNVPEYIKSLQFRKTFTKHLKKMYLSELPTEKRTRTITFKKHNPNELEQLFNETDDDTTFLGFEVSYDLATIFDETGNDNTFLGFRTTC